MRACFRFVPVLSIALAACSGGSNGQVDSGGNDASSDTASNEAGGTDAGLDALARDGGGDGSVGRDTGAMTDANGGTDSGANRDTGTGGRDSGAGTDSSLPGHAIQTVFIILMENHNWSQVHGSGNAPYIDNMLLPMASYTDQYFNPPGLHPSEPNYIWLEAGSNLGVTTDSDPVDSSGNPLNSQTTTDHLVAYLENAGVSWKSYQEDITGTSCPLHARLKYAPKHNPMVFFEDMTDANSLTSQHCIDHVRPYTELAADLTNNTVARYNFITPNLCDDMHNSTGCATTNSVSNGDTWLSQNVPAILASTAFQNGGVLFITWDEGEGSDGPIGMIVLSPLAKGGGYHNTVHYTHSSTLRTIQEIFAVTPLLRDAANATDLSDLFTTFP